MNSSVLLNEAGRLKNELGRLEEVVSTTAQRGATAYRPIAHELTEAQDALGRVVELLSAQGRGEH
jgi:hypothetical protein